MAFEATTSTFTPRSLCAVLSDQMEHNATQNHRLAGMDCKLGTQVGRKLDNSIREEFRSVCFGFFQKPLSSCRQVIGGNVGTAGKKRERGKMP